VSGQPRQVCRAHLAPIKCPRSIDFVAELPRPTGKLYKTRLIEQYRTAAAVE
jgi:acyl-coenzyme A synthetase/AMP-(fatty) acid ligase